jgi:hypothetical protein
MLHLKQISTTVLLAICSFLNAQYHLNTPGGQLLGLARNADTLYFWGENHVWRSTDSGETMEKYIELISETSAWTSPYTSQQGTWQDFLSASVKAGYFVFSDKNLYSGAGSSQNYKIFCPEFGSLYNLYNSSGSTALNLNFGLFAQKRNYNSIEFYFKNQQGLNKIFKWFLPSNNPSYVVPQFYIYNNDFLIGLHANKLIELNTIDSIFTEIDFPGNPPQTTDIYQNISTTKTAIFGQGSTFYVYDWQAKTIETKDHPFFPYTKKWVNGNEITYQIGTEFKLFNIFTNQILPLNNLPTGLQNMDFHFVGHEYALFFNKKDESFRYTKDWGATWQNVNLIGMQTDRFSSMFNSAGYIYAFRDQKLFRTPCAQPEALMEYWATLPDNFKGEPDNFSTTLVCDSTLDFNAKPFLSYDFGLTWQRSQHPLNFIDYDYVKCYSGYDTYNNTNDIMTFLKSDDLGVSWDSIIAPNNLTTLVRGFAAIGDTIILNNSKSFDGGLTWSPINFNMTGYYSARIIDVFNGKIIVNVIKTVNSGNSGVEFFNFDGTVTSSNLFPASIFYGQRIKNHELSYYRQTPMSNGIGYFTLRNRVPLFLNATTLYFNDATPPLVARKKGLADNYVYTHGLVYPLAQKAINISTCKVNTLYNNQIYSSGDHIFGNDACNIDTFLRVNAQLVTRNLPIKYVCEGQTLLFNGITVDSTILLADTVLVAGADCDTLLSQQFYLFPNSQTQTYSNCQGEIATYNGMTITSDTTLLTNYIFSPDSTCQQAVLKKFHFYPTEIIDTLPVINFCAGTTYNYQWQLYDSSVTIENYVELYEFVNNTQQHYCKLYIQDLVETPNPIISDTLAPYYFCGNNPFYFQGEELSDSVFFYTVNAANCQKKYQQFIRKPTLVENITLSGTVAIYYNGVSYTNDTTFTEIIDYQTLFCDSLIKTVHIDILPGDCNQDSLPVEFFNPTCYQNSDGFIAINGIYESQEDKYQFIWSNGSSNRNLLNVKAGDYSVIVVGEMGCLQNMFTLTEPPILSIEATQINPCKAMTNGSIATTATGGNVGAIQFLWNTGEINSNLFNLETGTYTIVVTDTKGCSAIKTLILNPLQLSADAFPNTSTGLFTVVLNTLGGNPIAPDTSFLFRKCDGLGLNCTNWSQDNVFIGLPSGSYQFQVKDNMACYDTLFSTLSFINTQDIKENESLYFENCGKINQVLLQPNPANDFVNLKILHQKTQENGCLCADFNGFGKVINQLGQVIQFFSFKKDEFSIPLKNLVDGVYFIEIALPDNQKMVKKLMVKNN